MCFVHITKHLLIQQIKNQLNDAACLKDPGRQEEAHKGRGKYMKKLKQSILNDAKRW